MSLSKRILLDSAFVLAVPFLPWYVLAAVGLLMFWKLDMVEVIGFGLLMDIAYGSALFHPASGLFRWIPFLPFAYGAIAAVWVLSLIQKRIR